MKTLFFEVNKLIRLKYIFIAFNDVFLGKTGKLNE